VNTVVFIGGLHDHRFDPECGCIITQRAVIAWKARAAKSIARTKIFPAYSAVLAHRFQYLVFIRCLGSICDIS